MTARRQPFEPWMYEERVTPMRAGYVYDEPGKRRILWYRDEPGQASTEPAHFESHDGWEPTTADLEAARQFMADRMTERLSFTDHAGELGRD
jgi:hypothetical protein